MKEKFKYVIIIGMILLLSACNKESNNAEDELVAEDVAESNESISSDQIHEGDEISVDENEVANEESDKSEDSSDKNESDELVEDEVIALDSSQELKNDPWIEQESIHLSSDETYVLYKKWMNEIDSMEFEVYIWDFINDPVMIDQATGFVTTFEVSPNEDYVLIHIGTSPISYGLIYDINGGQVVGELPNVDMAIWSNNSQYIVGRQIVFTEENSREGYNENILLWKKGLDQTIEGIQGKYGIHFDDIEARDDEIFMAIEYPDDTVNTILVEYETIIQGNDIDLYNVNTRAYIEALIGSEDVVDQDSYFMINSDDLDYAIYWNMFENKLMIWTSTHGQVVLEEAQGAYTDLAVSPNNRYVALTSGTSPVRELIVIDGKTQEIIYRGGPVYDPVYWSNDNKYLAYNTLNDITINLDLEISESMDVGVLDIETLTTKLVAKGTDQNYVLVEGFRDLGLDVYEADLMFQKTIGYTIIFEEIEELFTGLGNTEVSNEDSDVLDGNEEDSDADEEQVSPFAQVEYKFENEYASKRVNDAINDLNKFYIESGYETNVGEGFLPLESNVLQYSIYDGFISLFFTFVYENEDGDVKKLYDSLTFHSRDGILIDFDTMFKAEEIENVFSQMLRDEAEKSGISLLKEFIGFSDEAKFYFIDQGIVVYFDEGVYTTSEQGPLMLTLLWDDLKGVIETSSLVY